MASLLLVDDDASLLELLANYMQELGYEVHTAVDGNDGLRTFFHIQPDLAILDVNMPQRDGWQLLERIRELTTTPVIMLTARDQEEDVLRGFQLGADDYVTKPFSFAEMAARVQSVLLRTQPQQASQDSPSDQFLQQGDLQVDLAAKRVWRHKELIPLTPTEFKLLCVLMQQPGEVISATTLVRAVWGEEYASEVGYVRRYIWHLRKKVELDPTNPHYIHSEHGFGYRFFYVPPKEE